MTLTWTQTSIVGKVRYLYDLQASQCKMLHPDGSLYFVTIGIGPLIMRVNFGSEYRYFRTQMCI